MTLHFKGKTALITGAGQGLGRHFAIELAARGCQVMINDLSKPSDDSSALADQVRDEIIAVGGVACSDYGDVVNQADSIVEHVIAEYGSLDIVINNAGILDWKTFDEMSLSDFERVFSVHLNGTVNILKAAWPHLKKSPAGRVVNMSSAATFGLVGGLPYATAKAAIAGLTRSLALEAQEFGVNVNAVMPLGYTAMSATMPEPYKSMFEQNLPAKAIAPFVTWLVHQDTDIKGEIFSVGGGRASRVLFGETAGVLSKANTAEEWAGLRGSLLSDELDVLPETSFDEAMVTLNALGVSNS